jgi:[acyl-carrier-protein] S-malonyltransferase
MSFAVLCPGQGSQHPEMLDLIARNEAAEAVLAQAEAVFNAGVREWLSRPSAIFRNDIAQPLLCMVEAATWSALRSQVPPPLAFAGYSIGELAAYGCAGALDPRELARLARARASAMDLAAAGPPSGLVAVRGLLRTELESIVAASTTSIAIVNGDDAFVVGGTTSALELLMQKAAERGAEITRLNVGLASHTPLLAGASLSFRSALEHSALGAPAIPVVASVNASWVTTRLSAIDTLAAQVSATVEWAACLDMLYERGCRIFLELGPGCALSRMARARLSGDVEARSVSEFRSLDAACAWLRRRSDMDSAADAGA